VHLTQKHYLKFPCGHQYSLGPFQVICPAFHLQPEANPEPLQIPTALIHRELPALDREHMESLKKPVMNNIMRFSQYQGKDEIKQTFEAQF
jgi:hypothetical protein